MSRIEGTHPRQGPSSFPHPVPADYTTPFEKEKGTCTEKICHISDPKSSTSGDRATWAKHISVSETNGK
jgi:hypothetical protein